MPNDEIQLRLTTDEANILLEDLGALPFVKVYTLIGKIQSQAAAQLAAASAATEAPAQADVEG